MSFFSDQILSKRGPLGKVWLASHLERKLSKSALLGTSIPQSVNAIIDSERHRSNHVDLRDNNNDSQATDDDVHAMALRLSGQLLLGVARIYSRKAKYLMDDCNEALIKIKMAFRVNVNSTDPSGNARARDENMLDEDDDGVVGGAGAGQHAGTRRANLNINLEMRGGIADFDMLFNADPHFGGGYGMGMWDEFAEQLATPQKQPKAKPATAKSTVSRQADITLPEQDDLDYDIDDPFALAEGSQSGIGSQEFRARSAEPNGNDFDLGLDLDLDLDLDLGLMNDDVNNELDLGLFDEDNFLLESPSGAAASQKAKTAGQSRIATIAARAQEREREEQEQAEGEVDLRDRSPSEVPSLEMGRHAATPLSRRGSMPPALAEAGAEGLDKSVLEGANDTFSSDLADGFQPAPDVSGHEMDFGGHDFDFDLGPDDGQRTPRAATPAVDAPADESAANATQDIEMTPKTAARIAEIAAASSARKRKEAATAGAAATTENGAASRPAKVRRQIIDSVTELAATRRVLGDSQSQSQSQTSIGNGIGANTREERQALGLIKPGQDFLPRTELELGFLEIRKNPVDHFFGGMVGFGSSGSSTTAAAAGNKENMFFYAAPPGLPNELKELFKVPLAKKGSSDKRAGDATVTIEEEERRKRARSAAKNGGEEDVELGRERQNSILNGHDNFDTMDFGGHDFYGGDETAHTFGNDDFQLDLDTDIANASKAISGRDRTPSRLGTPSMLRENPLALDETLNLDLNAIAAANDSVLAVFDSAKKSASVAGASTSTTISRQRNGLLSVPGTRNSMVESIQEEDEDGDETQQSNAATNGSGSRERRGRTGGWARNTVKALKILEHELQPREDEEKEISFNQLADKASRKAAASMFFETLILGTRDCLKLRQPEAYGDISIQGKPKLWDVVDGLNKLTVSSRTEVDGVAPSREATPIVRSRVSATPA